MTILALKLSRRANAVSSVHGQVSRAMWTSLFPGRSEEQVPIGHITNGIHVRTWLAQQMHQLYDRHLGPDWPDRCTEPGCWDEVDRIEDGELWETHQTLKTQLIEAARFRAARSAENRRESSGFIDQMRQCAQPRRTHDRVCPPLRDLQAGESSAPGSREPDCRGERSASPRAIHLCRKSAPPRRSR